MNKWFRSALSVLLVAAAVVAGCSKGSQSGDVTEKAGENQSKPKEPVTVSISMPVAWVEEPVAKEIERWLAVKSPHITVKWVEEDKDHSLDQQVTAGTVPDIVLVSLDRIPALKKLKLEYDMGPLIKQFRMDLGQFEQSALDMVKNAHGKDEQIALPYTIGFSALYYNKDIFDKFGVSYPKDGMTWEEIRDLAVKVTRMDGGLQYRGIGFSGDPTVYLGAQLSLPFVDANSGKALLNNDAWNKVLSTAKMLYDIPGADPAVFKSGHNPFIKEKSLAMFVANNEVRNFKEDLNWDMVALPVFKERPGISRTPIGISLAITSASKHKEDAFMVVSAFLSDEVQLAMVRNGRPTSLKSDSIRKEFGGGFTHLKGKNLQAIYVNKPAPTYRETEFDPLARNAMAQILNNVLTGATDVNTALREADEKANLAIAAEKTKQ